MSKLWHIATREEIEDTLNTDFERGITNEFAKSMLRKSKKTAKKTDKSVSGLLYFNFLFSVVLVVLSVIFMQKGKMAEVIAVVTLVVISEILRYVMNVLSKKAEKAHKDLLKTKITVIRNAEKISILKDNITRGDIVVLEKGDIVPCDGRITYCENLKVTQDIDGVKEEKEKCAEAELEEETSIKDRANMLFEGSVILSGSCKMVACEIGEKTVIKKTKTETQEKKDTDRKVKEVSMVLTVFMFISIVLLFGVCVFTGVDLVQSALACAAVGAVLISVQLPAIISYTVNKGILKMAQSGNVVKDKEIAQRLAMCDTLVLGKTGIITNPQAKVRSIISCEGNIDLDDKNLSVPQKSIAKIILEFASICTKETKNNSSFEEQTIDVAILKAAQKADAVQNEIEIEKEYPFDMNSKIMTVCAASQQGYRIITKGDIKKVLEMCNKAVSTAQLEDITEELKVSLTEQYEEKLKEGYKVLALAYKDSESIPEENLGEDFILLGILVIENTINEEAVKAVDKIIKAGIRPVMVSYDDQLLCKAVAIKCGIIKEDEKCITGKMMDEMTDEELDESSKSTFVFAELLPSHKERIIESLKRNGKTVCMMSQGVSDENAMVRSDIAVSGKDGAKANESVSDLVTNGTLLGLIDSMKQAQKLYLDTRKIIRFAFSGAIGLMLFLIFTTLFTGTLPLSHLHIMLMGVITTGILPYAFPFGAYADMHVIKNVKDSGTIFKSVWTRILSCGILTFALAFILFVKIRYFNEFATDEQGFMEARTTVFWFFVLYQILTVLYFRKTAFILKEGKKELCVVLATLLVVLFGTVYVIMSASKSIFGFYEIDLSGVVPYAAIYIVIRIIIDVFKTLVRCITKRRI